MNVCDNSVEYVGSTSAALRGRDLGISGNLLIEGECKPIGLFLLVNARLS